MGISMYEIIKEADKYELNRIYSNSREFVEQIEYLRTVKAELKISELIKETLGKTGYLQTLKNENTVEAESRIENIEEFLTVAQEFEDEEVDNDLASFLEGITLSSDIDGMEEEEDSITLMTLHSAKGLEFPTVFLVGMEEGIFPGYKSIIDESEIEEERRLFYVGITRAKRFLYLTCSKHRTIFGSTSYNSVSRFVEEIPVELLDNQSKDTSSDSFGDSKYNWSYGGNSKVTTYKVDKSEFSEQPAFSFRTADSFLSELNKKKEVGSVDVSQYKVGQKIYHKKFGEGVITKLDPEGDDYKVDIEFDKVGHKRLMAKFAGLEIIE